MRRNPRLQTTAATLALLFLGALGTEAYGLHSCPLHHHHPASPDRQAELHAGGDAPEGDVPLPICVCVGSCHAGASAPVPSVGSAGELLAPAPVLRVAAGPRRETAPDRDAYFLPYPNGPPPA